MVKSTVSTGSTAAGSAAPTISASVVLPTPGRPAKTASTIGSDHGRQMRLDLGGGLVAVGVGEALEEEVRLDVVFLRADRLQHERGDQRAHLRGPFEADAPAQGGEEAGPEAVADAGRVVRDDVAGEIGR